MAARRKNISQKEKQLAKLLAQGYNAIEAARKVFGWKCEPYTTEAMKAKDLSRSVRVKTEIGKVRAQLQKQAQVDTILTDASRPDWDNLRQFAYDRLIEIRDDPTTNVRSRWEAIKALERLSDPSKDINLIWRWVDLVWRGYMAHCPCCHKNVPLQKIHNNKLTAFRETAELPDTPPLEGVLDRRLYILKQAEKRKDPHVGQIKALEAPERHIAGMGAARGGKSFLLGVFGYLYFLIPGVEIWLLARVYDDARSEVEYIEGFLKTLFHPVYDHVVTKLEDKKSGEIALVSRWGSELRVKSGKSAGSITGRELEAILVAEPAWVDASLFDEVRARMSSRLGRILAVGTPKGYGGFLHRLTRLLGRTREGKKIKPEDRLISNGSPWGKSMYRFNMDPRDNPEYVKSEQDAAIEELTDDEYASTFLGEMRASQGARFAFVRDEHLIQVPRDKLVECVFGVGIDQGEKNFASVIGGTDGKDIFITHEYFDNTNSTIKANMIKVNQFTPGWVSLHGGHPNSWKLTIFDADPPVANILDEMETEGREWTTDLTYRPKNKKDFMNWREETYIWINQMAQAGHLWFDMGAEDLHQQVMECLRRPPPEGKESKATSDKGWIVNDPWRGDHVLDAFVMLMWLFYTQALELPEPLAEPL